MITEKQLKVLKHSALAQPVKEWAKCESEPSAIDGARMFYVSGPGHVMCHAHGGLDRIGAAFIAAADPATILALLTERECLIAQVKALQAAPDSWQSGYNEGRRMGTKTAYSEREQLKNREIELKAGNEALRGQVDTLAEWLANALNENAELRAEREGMALIPATPSPGLLMSMAIRYDHGLGCPGYYDASFFAQTNGFTHQQRLESVLREMRKLHEEVVGAGFYSPSREGRYASLAKEANNV